MEACDQYCEAIRRGGAFGSPDTTNLPKQGSDELRPSQPDAWVAAAQAELLKKIVETIRESLEAPSTEAELDDSIDALLDQDWLFRGILELPKGPVQGDHLRSLARYAGDECAATVRFLLIQSARAFAALEEFCLKNQVAATPDPDLVDPFTLFVPSLYLGCPALPMEVQRALMGRDVAQIVLLGLVAGPRWGLPQTRVLELCARFKKHQPYWIEFMSAGSPQIDPQALPEERTNFAEAFLRNQRANEGIERAGKHLDSTGETVYFLNRRSLDEAGCR